jgi:hypothetical protein
MATEFTDWRQIAKLASTETDSAKLMELVNELDRILGEEEDALYKRRNRRDPPTFALLGGSLTLPPSPFPMLKVEGSLL